MGEPEVGYARNCAEGQDDDVHTVRLFGMITMDKGGIMEYGRRIIPTKADLHSNGYN